MGCCLSFTPSQVLFVFMPSGLVLECFNMFYIDSFGKSMHDESVRTLDPGMARRSYIETS